MKFESNTAILLLLSASIQNIGIKMQGFLNGAHAEL